MSSHSLSDITTTVKTKLDTKLNRTDEAASVQWNNVSNKPTIITSINDQIPTENGNVDVVFENSKWYKVGDDAFIGDNNSAGAVCIKGANGNTALNFVSEDESTSKRIELLNGGLSIDQKNIVTSVNGATADINGNVSISIPGSPRAYVTEIWRNGDNWYKVWNNGFIEQGGTIVSPAMYTNITQNLFRHFSSNNYGLQLSICMNSGAEVSIAAYSKNNASFVWRAFRTYDGSNSIHSVSWYACGY